MANDVYTGLLINMQQSLPGVQPPIFLVYTVLNYNIEYWLNKTNNVYMWWD